MCIRDSCYVTIASQPIDALDEFKANSYCIFEIEPWGIRQVKSLMATFQIADDTIKEDDSSISEYLLKKSQGNALYLNYILRQLRNSNVNKELIDGIPDYDISLSEYYSYLYKKIHNNRTVNAPVSYTHLDVYKRQDIARAPRAKMKSRSVRER